jgi:hypothetical protein
MIMAVLLVLTAAARPAGAATFTRTPIAPDLGLDTFTRAVTRAKVSRDLFANPYSTVTISNVDLYDRFPFVEARHFEVVSDPQWNRLVYGELGQGVAALSSAGATLGVLSAPHGLAVDERNRVYVADTGNNRIVVFQATTQFDQIDLVPLFAISDLSGPFDVAYSDGGTPFVEGDDRLYVADTGNNQVVAYSLTPSGATRVAAIGSLGGGVGHFAGPMAITAGRSNGVNTHDVFVADAHNGRLVHLNNTGSALQWVGEAKAGADLLTSLDTDQWGNLYAAAPHQGVVRKFNASLEPVDDLRNQLSQPRSFHVPFFNITDHRSGSVVRVGQAQGVSVDRWSDQSGVVMWNLGPAIAGLAVTGGTTPAAQFTLTDQAAVTLEFSDASDGHVLSRRSVDALGAGVHSIGILPADLPGTEAQGSYVLKLTANSSYSGGGSDVATIAFKAQGGGAVAMPTGPALLGNWPNPARPSTRIAFSLPAGAGNGVSLSVYDTGGRRVRTFQRAFTPGLNEVTWDGTDDRGALVRSGMYFYRLDVGHASMTRRLVLVR